MSDSLDAYHKWLGIPPSEQPPNAYRLLGLRPFEPNAEVIQNAVDRQTIHLRTFQLGEHAAASQRLLNEVAAARLTLLDPDKKAQYDQQLSAELKPAVPIPVMQASPSGEPALLGVPRPPGTSPLQPVARRRSRRLSALLCALLAAIILLVAAVYVLSMFSSGDGRSSPQAGVPKPSRADRPPSVAPEPDAQRPIKPTPETPEQPARKPERWPAEPPRTTVIVSDAHHPAPTTPKRRPKLRPKSDDHPTAVKPPDKTSPAPRKTTKGISPKPSTDELNIELPSGATVSQSLLRNDLPFILREFERSVQAKDAPVVALSRRNGRPLALVQHDGGVLHGPALLLYRTGQVKMLIKYDHGNRDGWLKTWDNRKHKRLWCRYVHGRRSGPACWFEDDQLRLIVEYRHNKPIAYHLIRQGQLAASYDDQKTAAEDKEAARLLADLEKFDEELTARQRELKQLVRRHHQQWRRRQVAQAKSKKRTDFAEWSAKQWTECRRLIRLAKQQSKF